MQKTKTKTIPSQYSTAACNENTPSYHLLIII